MQKEFDFNAIMLNILLQKTISDKINFSNIMPWHQSHPYLRLNYYNGIQMSQVLGVYLVLSPDFIQQFDTIVEIGTYNGGLTSYLYDMKKENAKLVSYDIDGKINHTKRTDIDFRVEDCFEEKAFNDIVEMIASPGRVLLICDGGDKPKEFNTFSKFLKSNDIIMAHDYKVDDAHWREATDYWQWPYEFDTTYDMIKEGVEENDLKPYKNEQFNFYLWTAYIKK
jgi:hypothetical protein